MIVDNRQEIIESASELVSELVLHIGKYFLEFKTKHDDDPAGYIYMTVHVLALLYLRMGKVIEEYSKIYGIEKLDFIRIREWVDAVMAEYESMINEEKPN